jgi:glycerate kinase
MARPLTVLVAPQELKGTLGAAEAARAIAAGILAAVPEARVDLAPIADGGPGTLDALTEAMGGRRVGLGVQDPLGRPVRAQIGVAGEIGVVEIAAAAGLTLLRPEERDPRRTSSFGAGQLVAAALDQGCREVLIGLGGSATNDGGAGALTALGARFLDAAGQPLPPGGAALVRLAQIDLSGLRLGSARLVALTDVRAPLLGPEGASAVFGPQKGATPEAVLELDAALGQLHQVARRSLGRDLAFLPGAGAAGGLGYGLAALAGAELAPGFERVARALRLEDRVRAADLVVTAEGRYDAQTALGKGPGALAAMARRLGRPAVMLAGSVAEDAPAGLFTLVRAISGGGPSLAAGEALTAAAREAAAHLRGTGGTA